jgi:hypothetical protein
MASCLKYLVKIRIIFSCGKGFIKGDWFYPRLSIANDVP